MTIVRAGQTLVISSGQVDSGTIILDGGREIVEAGGTAMGTVVSSGGLQTDSGGTIIGATVAHYGYQEVYAGTASGTTLLFGGTQWMLGGSATGTTVHQGGDLLIESGANVSDVTLSNGGRLAWHGGTLSGLNERPGGTIQLYGGGSLVVSSGQTYYNVELNSGGQVVLDGGTIDGLKNYGGDEIIGSGITVSDTTVSGYRLIVAAGATARDITVVGGGGGQIVLEGGNVSDLKFQPTVYGPAGEAVASGGAVRGLIVDSGVTLTVSSGGTATDTVLLSGGGIVYDGGTVHGITTNAGSVVTVASGAKLILSSGMHLASVDVQLDGEIELAGGVVDQLYVADGAIESVADGVTLSNFHTFDVELIVSSGGNGCRSGVGRRRTRIRRWHRQRTQIHKRRVRICQARHDRKRPDNIERRGIDGFIRCDRHRHDGHERRIDLLWRRHDPGPDAKAGRAADHREQHYLRPVVGHAVRPRAGRRDAVGRRARFGGKDH